AKGRRCQEVRLYIQDSEEQKPGRKQNRSGEMMEQPQSARISQKAVSTRQRILDTALGLFATKGYEKTTMREIATAAHCSLGLAYRYFASKEELVLELYRNLVR